MTPEEMREVLESITNTLDKLTAIGETLHPRMELFSARISALESELQGKGMMAPHVHRFVGSRCVCGYDALAHQSLYP